MPARESSPQSSQKERMLAGEPYQADDTVFEEVLVG
jgi:hypothetical protein